MRNRTTNEEKQKLLEANCGLMDRQYVWSTSKALIGLYKNTLGTREGIFFTITTLLLLTVFRNRPEAVYWIMYCVVGICFVFFKSLEKLIGSGNLNINKNLSKKL